jgi:flagellar hook-basal body complex protein FliE
MDLKLTPTKMPVASTVGASSRLGTKPDVGGLEDSFSGALSSALKSVSNSQNQSSRLQQEVQMGNPKVSLEETMVSIQKAQIGFQAALHVRNRMVQAYTDIMNMQV